MSKIPFGNKTQNYLQDLERLSSGLLAFSIALATFVMVLNEDNLVCDKYISFLLTLYLEIEVSSGDAPSAR